MVNKRICMWNLSNGESVASWCRENDVIYKCVLRRIHNGEGVDEACYSSKKCKGRKDMHSKYFCEGVNLKKYCLDNKINYFRVYYWIKKGYSIEESLEITKKRRKNGKME